MFLSRVVSLSSSVEMPIVVEMACQNKIKTTPFLDRKALNSDSFWGINEVWWNVRWHDIERHWMPFWSVYRWILNSSLDSRSWMILGWCSQPRQLCREKSIQILDCDIVLVAVFMDVDLHTSDKESWNNQQSITTTSRIQDDEDESSVTATISGCFHLCFSFSRNWLFKGFCESSSRFNKLIETWKGRRVEGSGWNVEEHVGRYVYLISIALEKWSVRNVGYTSVFVSRLVSNLIKVSSTMSLLNGCSA